MTLLAETYSNLTEWIIESLLKMTLTSSHKWMMIPNTRNINVEQDTHTNKLCLHNNMYKVKVIISINGDLNPDKNKWQTKKRKHQLLFEKKEKKFCGHFFRINKVTVNLSELF